MSMGTPCEQGPECDGVIDVTVTSGEAPFTYSWSNGATTEDVSNACPGTYSVTITDAKWMLHNADDGGGLQSLCEPMHRVRD